MNRTDDQLRAAILWNEKLADRSGWVLLVGLALELLLIFAWWPHEETLLTRMPEAFATLLIVLGVWGELHFGRKESEARAELQKRSDVLIAELNLARVELERKYAWRRLTKEQASLLTSALRGNVARVDVGSIGDPEAEEYARDIATALRASEIRGDCFTVLGAGVARGVSVSQPANGDGTLVLRALAAAGIVATRREVETPHANINIGARERPD